jgi:hypothetical protein
MQCAAVRQCAALCAAVCGCLAVCAAVRVRAAWCGCLAVRQCAYSHINSKLISIIDAPVRAAVTGRQCVRQYVTVVCGSAAVCAEVYMRQCGSVRSSVRQCAGVCCSVWQCAAVCGSVRQ